MKLSLLKNRIAELGKEADIIVLKGFPIDDVLRLSNEYHLADEGIIQDGKINLNNINSMGLFPLLTSSDGNTHLLLYESFLDLTTLVRNISAFGKKICVLSNNLLTRYENQTTEDIPDFDSSDFQKIGSPNGNFVKYYSFCSHIEGKQYVQLIEYYVDDRDSIIDANLFDPVPVKVKGFMPEGTYEILSTDNGSVDKLFEQIYHDRLQPFKSFLIEKEDSVNDIFGVLQSASDSLNLGLTFYWVENKVNVEIRHALYSYLESTWGYTSFRDLNMYRDLNVDHSTIKVSQGEVIETVVREAELALKDDNNSKNVLLTSPTGAGKSLLFQLSAIYLAETYGCLTIVVSPLVALMNDQVDNLVGNYKGVATINGNVPAADKEEIIEKVKRGEINILYLAPELLLSYTISSFVGERRIGLFVVDEAHTVTTWGRDFRVDYWFLGDYLRQSKRVLGYSFPIFALTATAVWDPSGRNDMVFDTIRSLNMDPCIKFIGVVRRDDIRFEIENPNIVSNYEKERNLLTIKRIHETIDKNEKAIVYFPYKSSIRKLKRYAEMDDVSELVTEYHASLTPAEKTVNADGFKTGEKLVMCATKAYGMGIDVSDINTVYHHAPTGCLSDYVQEIGRVARDPKITGLAKIDFSDKDFKYTRTLHGLSAIRPYQLMAVIRKLMALYKMKGEKRNMLISSSDFEYIFPGKDVDYDQKVKSCLLLISNDLLNKLRFHAIIVRPKNLFSKAYISVPHSQKDAFQTKYDKYAKLVDSRTNTFLFDLDELWNRSYSNLTFPNFKWKVAQGEIFKNFDVSLKNKVTLSLTGQSVGAIRQKMSEFFTYAHKVLDKMNRERHRMTFEEIKQMLPSQYSNIEKEAFIETFKMVYATENGITGNLNSFCSIHMQNSVQLIGQGYGRAQSLYMDAFDKNIDCNVTTIFCMPYSNIVKLAELLNSLNLADYERLGGDKPSIFIRINNPAYMNDLVRHGHYENAILENIYEKFNYSEWVYSFFFTNKMSNKQRWDFIEAYFLGASKEELIEIGSAKQ